ncbi:MAG: hypothetical protein NVSMB62_17820 [Acidobacteriaceae bacterium]
MTQQTQPERVLIIDDDVMSREVLTVLLGSEGFTVESVSCGEAALTHLRDASRPGDIILADLQMPGLAGPELARALRHICPPHTLILGMSGSAPLPSVIEAFDAFLLKPFRAQQLMDVTQSRRHPKVVDERAETPSADTPSESPQASNQIMSSLTHHQAPSSNPVRSSASAAGGTELDERIYRQLHEAMPGRQLRQMYTLCLDDVRKRIVDMRLLAGHHDVDQFVRQAHAIKGGCGMLGASELYTMASRLEKTGLGAPGLEGAQGVNPLDELDSACDRLERILETRT